MKCLTKIVLGMVMTVLSTSVGAMKQVKNLERKICVLEKLLNDKDKKIVRKNRIIERKNREIRKRNRKIEKKNETIKNYEKLIANATEEDPELIDCGLELQKLISEFMEDGEKK